MLGGDNILLIKGQSICVIFDYDFDSYLIDHALPIRNSDSRSGVYEKQGMTFEDIGNIVKLAIHVDIKNNHDHPDNE